MTAFGTEKIRLVGVELTKNHKWREERHRGEFSSVEVRDNVRAMEEARGGKDGASRATKCVKVENIPLGLDSEVELAIKSHFGQVGTVEAVEIMGGGVVLAIFRYNCTSN